MKKCLEKYFVNLIFKKILVYKYNFDTTILNLIMVLYGFL